MVINIVNIAPAEEWTALPVLWMKSGTPAPQSLQLLPGLRGQRGHRATSAPRVGGTCVDPSFGPQGMNRVPSPLSGAHWPLKGLQVSGQLWCPRYEPEGMGWGNCLGTEPRKGTNTWAGPWNAGRW